MICPPPHPSTTLCGLKCIVTHSNILSHFRQTYFLKNYHFYFRKPEAILMVHIHIASITYAVSGDCNVRVENRQDCGYPGITKEACNAKGCCFNNQTLNTIQCFTPKQTDKRTTSTTEGKLKLKSGFGPFLDLASTKHHQYCHS